MSWSGFKNSRTIAESLASLERGFLVFKTRDKWRAKFGGMDTSMMARMKELEDENRRLKKMYLEEKLKAEIANEYLAKK